MFNGGRTHIHNEDICRRPSVMIDEPKLIFERIIQEDRRFTIAGLCKLKDFLGENH